MSSSIQAWFRRWGPALILMTVIFIASSIPGDELPKFDTWDFDIKKAGHALGYAMLALAYLRGLTNRSHPAPRHLILAILLAGMYAITDEFHQSFTPGRSPSAMDVLIDTAGATAGISIWAWIWKWRNSPARPGS